MRAMPPTTRYAKSGAVHIAYQVVGEGPPDLVLAYGYGSNVEMQWEHPRFAAFLDDLGALGRLVLFDKRDTGLSDRTGRPPTLEERADDMRAVMDAAGVERAVVLGMTGGGPIAALFAAMHPERVESLVLYATIANWAKVPPEVLSGVGDDVGPSPQYLDAVAATWGTGITAHLYARSMIDEPGFVDWCARYERSMASPGNASTMVWMAYQWDLRPVLPTISAPALVLWRPDDRSRSGAAYQEVADLVPNARGVALPGVDHWPWVGDTDALLNEIRRFLPYRSAATSTQLAAVLFTDIVGSTRHVAAAGDRQWHVLLDRHDALAQQLVERFHGRLVKGTGDGILATFDGPVRAIRCAHALGGELHALGISIRAGVHVGEIDVRGNDLGGIAVNIASRVCDVAGADEIYVTRTVRDLIAGSGLMLHDAGAHALKGVPDSWSLYRVADGSG
jgi:pimeloyl-ACP methyl ester carboxylesterase/class 3 adenylate cyclase